MTDESGDKHACVLTETDMINTVDRRVGFAIDCDSSEGNQWVTCTVSVNCSRADRR